MRVAALMTGGKDSTLALYHALKQGLQVAYLVTMIPRREDSWMFHSLNLHIMEYFAQAVGIPLVKGFTNGIKEEEVKDLERLIARLNVKGVVSGAIASTYQKSRIEEICARLGLNSITPLWRRSPISILNEILWLKFEVIIVGVFAEGLDQEWLGRKLDKKLVKELLKLNEKYGISIVGEGGEYETLVLDAPFFEKKIQILETQKVWRGDHGYLKVTKAKLGAKPT
jgi:predicted ATP pyrophosphatase (TIGR00289 family)